MRALPRLPDINLLPVDMKVAVINLLAMKEVVPTRLSCRQAREWVVRGMTYLLRHIILGETSLPMKAGKCSHNRTASMFGKMLDVPRMQQTPTGGICWGMTMVMDTVLLMMIDREIGAGCRLETLLSMSQPLIQELLESIKTSVVMIAMESGAMRKPPLLWASPYLLFRRMVTGEILLWSPKESIDGGARTHLSFRIRTLWSCIYLVRRLECQIWRIRNLLPDTVGICHLGPLAATAASRLAQGIW
jgi:hypothetical protein